MLDGVMLENANSVIISARPPCWRRNNNITPSFLICAHIITLGHVVIFQTCSPPLVYKYKQYWKKICICRGFWCAWALGLASQGVHQTFDLKFLSSSSPCINSNDFLEKRHTYIMENVRTDNGQSLNEGLICSMGIKYNSFYLYCLDYVLMFLPSRV